MSLKKIFFLFFLIFGVPLGALPVSVENNLAGVNENEVNFLNDLSTRLRGNFRSSEYKEAYSELLRVVDENKGSLLLNSFFSRLALARPHSENSSDAFKLWAEHSKSLSVEDFYHSAAPEVYEALRVNLTGSTSEKHPAMRAFVFELGLKDSSHPQFYALLKSAASRNLKQNAKFVAEVYSELLNDPRSSKASRTHLLKFLSEPDLGLTQVKVELLHRLKNTSFVPTSEELSAAAKLADNSTLEVEKVFDFFNSMAQRGVDLSAQEHELMASIKTVLLERGEGEGPLKAASFLQNASLWVKDKSALGVLLNELMSPESTYGANRASSGALLYWKNHKEDFFASIFDNELKASVESQTAKSGKSITTKNCRALLDN